MKILITLIIACAFLQSGCATRSSAKLVSGPQEPITQIQAVSPESVQMFEGDVLDRQYTVLGDIQASVSKTTVFNKDPTNDMVAKKLREEAAKMGADAVIFVRYGTVGISFTSWGKLDGTGRAIKFVEKE